MYLAERGQRRMGYEYGVRDGYHGRVAQEQASLGYGMFLHNPITSSWSLNIYLPLVISTFLL